jgi:hypothetical protein
VRTLLIIAAALLSLVAFTVVLAEPVPSPGIEILAEGCSPCATGDRATFVLNADNPGPARGVRVVALLRLPSGVVYPLPAHNGRVELLPAGPSSLTLADFIVPAGDPGAYLIEAALLDVTTGTTLARHVLGVVKD